ncbi:MAG: Mrp/NBP35 family ATP-binding protein [Campylobacteraceae bacterium]|nr:Mrp/NBP35 family ATP-binding protein [Campylobacteraceae bacterium]
MFKQDDVKKLLSSVKYPEFEKDIVTFGFVKNIEIKDKKAFVDISIVSANPNIAKKVQEDASNALNKGGISAEVRVEQPKIPEQKSNSQSNKNIASNIKNFVMVSSGKGGVGKSTTTVNLALCLSKQGKKVGILDADIYGPNIPRMLGITDSKPIILGEKLKPITAYGIEMMSMGVLMTEGQSLIWRGAMIMRAVEQLLRDVLWSDLDVLFIDMPPGTGDAQLTLAQSVPVTCGVCVTTPQTVALDDAKRSLDMFRKLHIPVAGIIENMSGFICSDCGKEYEIFGKNSAKELAEEYNAPILANIPIELCIREGSDEGKPVAIFNEEAISFKRYADAANKILQTIEQINKNGGGDNSKIQPTSTNSACSAKK